MAKMFSENTAAVLAFLQAHDGDDMTAADIAEAMNKEVKSINGVLTAGLQRKGLIVREEAEVETEDGKHQTVKFVRLTDEGKAADPDAEKPDAE